MSRREAPHVRVMHDEVNALHPPEDVLEDGFRVTAMTSPPTDLADVVALAPDLVVLGMLIGGEGSGSQLLQQLGLDRETARLPVVVCAAAVHLVRGA